MLPPFLLHDLRSMKNVERWENLERKEKENLTSNLANFSASINFLFSCTAFSRATCSSTFFLRCSSISVSRAWEPLCFSTIVWSLSSELENSKFILEFSCFFRSGSWKIPQGIDERNFIHFLIFILCFPDHFLDFSIT